MRLNGPDKEGEYEVRFDRRRELLEVARANGLWRFNSLRLVVRSVMADSGGLGGIALDTTNLLELNGALHPPHPEIMHYLGTCALESKQPVPAVATAA